FESLPVFGQQQPLTILFRWYETEGIHGRFRRSYAQPGEPLELGERRRPDPLEVPARQFHKRLFAGKLEFGERIRPPQRIAVSLAVQAAVQRYAANLAACLQLS